MNIVGSVLSLNAAAEDISSYSQGLTHENEVVGVNRARFAMEVAYTIDGA